MATEVEAKLERVLARVGDLPAMPETVAEVLRLADDPDVEMGKIGDVISRDPALTAKILRVSNSSYYGMRQYVGTIKLALVILGVREVRNIVLGVSLFESMRSETSEDVLTTEYWTHCFSAASMCKDLGNRLKLKLQGEDFVAGLLHDIGKMVLCRQLGDDYANLFRRSKGDPTRLLELEVAELEFTHAEVGAALCARWNLPKTLSDSIWCHHPVAGRDLRTAKDPSLASVVRIANLALHDNLTSAVENESLACTDTEAWSILATAPVPLLVDERREFLTTLVRDIIARPPLKF